MEIKLIVWLNESQVLPQMVVTLVNIN